MGGLVQSSAVAANLRAEGLIDNAQILLAMLVGSAVGNPFRTRRRSPFGARDFPRARRVRHSHRYAALALRRYPRRHRRGHRVHALCVVLNLEGKGNLSGERFPFPSKPPPFLSKDFRLMGRPRGRSSFPRKTLKREQARNTEKPQWWSNNETGLLDQRHTKKRNSCCRRRHEHTLEFERNGNRAGEFPCHRVGVRSPTSGCPAPEWRVARRLIHTTADMSIADALVFRHDAIGSGLCALRAGAPIFCDSKMIRARASHRAVEEAESRLRSRKPALPYQRSGRHRSRQTRRPHPCPVQRGEGAAHA